MLSNFRLDAGVPVVQDMNDVGIVNRPEGAWNHVAKRMVQEFANTKHPIFVCVELFVWGAMRVVKGTQATQFQAATRNKMFIIGRILECNSLLIIAAVCVEYGRRHTWSAQQSFGRFQTYRLRRSRCWRTEETISAKGTLCDLFLFRHCRNCSMSRIFRWSCERWTLRNFVFALWWVLIVSRRAFVTQLFRFQNMSRVRYMFCQIW